MLTLEEQARLLDEVATPGQRALVLVTLENANSIHALTAAVREMVAGQTAHQHKLNDIESELTSHIKEESTLLTWGVRMFAMIASVLAFVVSFSGWYVGNHIIGVNDRQQIVMDMNSNRLTALESAAKIPEKYPRSEGK